MKLCQQVPQTIATAFHFSVSCLGLSQVGRVGPGWVPAAVGAFALRPSAPTPTHTRYCLLNGWEEPDGDPR